MWVSLYLKGLSRLVLIEVSNLLQAKKRGGLREQRHHPKCAIQLGGAELQIPLEGGSRGERIRCAQFNRHYFGVFVARKVSAFVKTSKKCEPANDSNFKLKIDSQFGSLAVLIFRWFYIFWVLKFSVPHPNYHQHQHPQSGALRVLPHFASV